MSKVRYIDPNTKTPYEFSADWVKTAFGKKMIKERGLLLEKKTESTKKPDKP